MAEDINPARFRLVLLTVDGYRVALDDPTGPGEPGSSLDHLGAQLLAMRDHHSAAP